MSDVSVKKKEYNMLVFVIVSLTAFLLIMWQWVITVRELDRLSQGQGQFKTVLPKSDKNL